jgi:phosphoglycolate phosphatase
MEERFYLTKIKTDGVILDIDGTLWNSTEIVAEAWIEAFKIAGVMKYHITPEILKSLFGKPMNEIAVALMPDETEEKRKEVSDNCYHLEDQYLEKNDSDIFYDGVVDGIIKLSERLPVYIVSNCQKGYIELVMKKGGLEKHITDYESYGNTGRGKAYNLKLLVERNHLDAPVYIGDTEGDRQACEEAGVPFIWASYGFGNPTSYVSKLDEFEDILDIV